MLVAVVYGIVAGLIMIFAGRTLSMIFVGKEAVDVLDASENIYDVWASSTGALES